MKKVIVSAMMIMAFLCSTTTVSAQSDNKPKAKKECCDKRLRKNAATKKLRRRIAVRRRLKRKLTAARRRLRRKTAARRRLRRLAVVQTARNVRNARLLVAIPTARTANTKDSVRRTARNNLSLSSLSIGLRHSELKNVKTIKVS